MLFAFSNNRTHVCDEVEEVDAVSVERQNVVRAFLGVRHSLHREEAGAKQRPLGQKF